MVKKLPKKKNLSQSDGSLSETPEVDAKVMEGAAIINMTKLTCGKAFRDYTISNKFAQFISIVLRQVDRVEY